MTQKINELLLYKMEYHINGHPAKNKKRVREKNLLNI